MILNECHVALKAREALLLLPISLKGEKVFRPVWVSDSFDENVVKEETQRFEVGHFVSEVTYSLKASFIRIRAPGSKASRYFWKCDHTRACLSGALPRSLPSLAVGQCCCAEGGSGCVRGAAEAKVNPFSRRA